MTQQQARDDLLEALAEQLDCCCLSDLRIRGKTALRSAIEGIPAERYSRRQWEDAVDYLLDERPSFLSAAQARRYLVQALTK